MARYVGERLELLHLLGEGGCASVWLGRHRDTGALLAVKVVRPGGDEHMLAERFRREAEISSRLNHRNIVRVFDFVHEADGASALVMEHLRGETLAEAVARRGPLDAEQAVAVLVPLLRGLEHAHAADVVHRDLKPSNVFLSVEPDGVVIPKLLDFGIAKATDSRAVLLTQQGEVLGTPAYMSPEQVRGDEIGPRSDVFAAGTLAYELLTGRMAFHAPSPHAAMMAILQRDIEPPAEISQPLWNVLQRALCKDPTQRYESAACMREALIEALGYDDERGATALLGLQLVIPVLPVLPARTPSSPGLAPASLAPTTLSQPRPSHDPLAETQPAVDPTWLPKPLGTWSRRVLGAAAVTAVFTTVGLAVTGAGRPPPSIAIRASLAAAASPPAAASAVVGPHANLPAIEVPAAAPPAASSAEPPRRVPPKAGARTKPVARTPGF